jgi:predicted lipoprotein with Yx(FWY)xxD motif
VRIGAFAIAALLIFGASACGGSGSGGSSHETLKLASNPDLKRSIIVDAKGMTLYVFDNDNTGGKATCVGNNPVPGCGKVWPPYVFKGKLEAGLGLNASLLGTTKRSDGKTQVTYDKHPLYYFAGYGGTPADKKPGDDGGQAFGGLWWVLSAKGTPITQQ